MRTSTTAIIILTALALSHCDDRINHPPKPEGVPEDAVRDRMTGLWQHAAPDTGFRLFYDNGNVAAQGGLAGAFRNGEFRMYMDDGERITSEGVYVQNWRDGTWKYYDGRGRLYLTVDYALEPRRFFGLIATTDYGNENGEYRRYYPDGSLEERGEFYSGYQHGPVVRYHPNGNKAYEGRYELDQPAGQWRYYYPDGTLEREERYTKGALDGPLRNYHADGSLYHETRYANGQEVGPKKIFPRKPDDA